MKCTSIVNLGRPDGSSYNVQIDYTGHRCIADFGKFCGSTWNEVRWARLFAVKDGSELAHYSKETGLVVVDK